MGGTLGFFARKRGDSGVGMLRPLLLQLVFRRMKFGGVWSVWPGAVTDGNGRDRSGI